MTKKIAAYGAWPSVITVAELTRGAKGFGQLGLPVSEAGGESAAGALYSTAHDLFLWDQARPGSVDTV